MARKTKSFDCVKEYGPKTNGPGVYQWACPECFFQIVTTTVLEPGTLECNECESALVEDCVHGGISHHPTPEAYRNVA